MIVSAGVYEAFMAARDRSEGDGVMAGLAAALDQFATELIDNAWEGGRARGAIKGALEQMEEAHEPPPLGYRARHR